MVRGGLIASALILSLAGCVETQSVATGEAASVGPGSAAVDSEYGSMSFADICIGAYAQPEKAKAMLLERGYVQHPQTKTFFNPRRNVSFKLMPKKCSMVFGSKDRADMVAFSFGLAVISRESKAKPAELRIAVNPDTGFATAKGPKGSTFEIAPAGSKQLGQTMYHAVLTAP